MNQSRPMQFGAKLRDGFLLDADYHNLNHGSFGSIPKVIQDKMRTYQMMAERRPDPFIRYEYPNLLDQSREAVASILKAPVGSCVFVPNATTAVNTVLRAMEWNADGKDVIVYFSTIYAGCGKAIDYVVDTSRGLVSACEVPLEYPVEDADVVSKFKAAARTLQRSGKRAKMCLFDIVSSMPGVRFPFEAMTAACKELRVLSLIDGAQGIGMVDMDLGALDPDFFTSNCHKWLHVPRGCAVFYAAERNHGLLPSTLPTSHGYVPEAQKLGGASRGTRLPPATKSVFVNNFEFVGTLDNAPYLCVKDAIEWREKALGGEIRILDYLGSLARRGGHRAAEILGTQVLDNSTKTLTNCAMVNVALPLAVAPPRQVPGPGTVAPEEASNALNWMLQTLMKDYNTFIALHIMGGRFWARLSAQVYLDLDDFEWAGRTLKDVTRRVGTEFRREIKPRL